MADMSFLQSGPLLLARLREACPAVNGRVFSAADLSGVQERDQVTPAVHLVLDRYQPLGRSGSGETRWEEHWMAVVVVKNVARDDRQMAQTADAAALAGEILAALDGWSWRDAGGTHLVECHPAPAPLFTDSHAYFPLGFILNTASLQASPLIGRNRPG